MIGQKNIIDYQSFALVVRKKCLLTGKKKNGKDHFKQMSLSELIRASN